MTRHERQMAAADLLQRAASLLHDGDDSDRRIGHAVQDLGLAVLSDRGYRIEWLDAAGDWCRAEWRNLRQDRDQEARVAKARRDGRPGLLTDAEAAEMRRLLDAAAGAQGAK
jgi:hypothetical protein